MKKNLAYILFALLVIISGCESESGIGPDGSSFDSNGVSQGGSTAKFATTGTNLYVIDQFNLHTYDISVEKEIRFLNSIYLNTQQLETIFPFGDYLFLGSTTGVHIIDISNPAAPNYLSEFQHVVSCDPVVTDGAFAYVTLRSGNFCGQSDDELQILDLSNISNPQLIATYSLTSPKGLAINNNILYVCDNGIRIFDVSDKSDVREIKYIPNIPANDVIFYNNRILVTADNGFYQFDVSDLIDVKQIGQFTF
jgi:hypothetical protein